MSIDGINGPSNWWQWQNQATQSSSTGASTGGGAVGGSIANSGSAAAANLPAFMQAFSADLQTMLTQLGSGTGSAATPSAGGGGAPDSASLQAASNQAGGATHHRHHHHHPAGASAAGATQSVANPLVGSAGASPRNATASADQINQSASVLAADVMQALRAYGAPASSASSGASILA